MQSAPARSPSVRGQAGASARAEYLRRTARHAERVQEWIRVWFLVALGISLSGIAIMIASPEWRLFGAAVTLFGVVWLAERVVNPLSTRVWRIGAEGEEATARLLAELEPDGYLVFHDLRIPRSRANIDHLVVGPTGVFVVDSKSFSGSVEERRGELWVGRRRRGKLIESARWQADVVRATLGPALDGLPVRPLLAVHRADFPLFRRRLEIDGVAVLPAKDVVALIRAAPVTLSTDRVQHLAALAEDRLRPMSR